MGAAPRGRRGSKSVKRPGAGRPEGDKASRRLTSAPPPRCPDPRQGWLDALQDRAVLAALAWDLGLLLLFVGQHSLMATEAAKAWTSRHFGVLQRSVYVACTALALQV